MLGELKRLNIEEIISFCYFSKPFLIKNHLIFVYRNVFSKPLSKHDSNRTDWKWYTYCIMVHTIILHLFFISAITLTTTIEVNRKNDQ